MCTTASQARAHRRLHQRSEALERRDHQLSWLAGSPLHQLGVAGSLGGAVQPELTGEGQAACDREGETQMPDRVRFDTVGEL
jgi:hypothetical protein